MAARGKMKERNWRRSAGGPATIDDISVFVIPVLPYKQEVARGGEGEEEGREAMEVEEAAAGTAAEDCDSEAPPAEEEKTEDKSEETTE